jgi:hypothetical protein
VCTGACAALLLALPVLSPQPSRASEESFGDQPAGPSVDSLGSALSRAVDVPEEEPSLFPRLKQALQGLPPFIADTDLRARARTFYFPLRQPSGVDAWAWALGGKVQYRSGWLAEHLQIGAGLYMSYPLAADDPLALTQLLRIDEKGYTIFGEAFVKLRHREIDLTLYRQELELPWVNRADTRMTPNSFEAYLFEGTHEKVGRFHDVDWVAGYVSDIRPRFADDFVPMAQAAGALDSNQGLWAAGAQFEPLAKVAGSKMHIGLYNYYVKDVLHITYLALDFQRDFVNGWAMRNQVQVTWQSSAGGRDLTGERFDTGVASLRSAVSKAGLTLWTGLSTTAKSEDIRSPWGTYPGFLSMMQSDFDRAGEFAWMFGLSYDFSAVGVPGLSGFTQYGKGNGGQDARTGVGNADEREVNLTVDYKIGEGRLRGLWFRARGSILDVQRTEATAYQVRLTINYDIPIL